MHAIKVRKAIILGTSKGTPARLYGEKVGYGIDSLLTNRQEIIGGAQAIEELLNSIIAEYFFGRNSPKKPIFHQIILSSNWCSFADKRKLIEWIIEDTKLLEGKPKQEFCDLLSKVGRWRNAFAHGMLGTNGDENAYINYFEGRPRKEDITDALLIKIETILNAAYDTCLELLKQQLKLSQI